jgi:hypothetical protein
MRCGDARTVWFYAINSDLQAIFELSNDKYLPK